MYSYRLWGKGMLQGITVAAPFFRAIGKKRRYKEI